MTPTPYSTSTKLFDIDGDRTADTITLSFAADGSANPMLHVTAKLSTTGATVTQGDLVWNYGMKTEAMGTVPGKSLYRIRFTPADLAIDGRFDGTPEHEACIYVEHTSGTFQTSGTDHESACLYPLGSALFPAIECLYTQDRTKVGADFPSRPKLADVNGDRLTDAILPAAYDDCGNITCFQVSFAETAGGEYK